LIECIVFINKISGFETKNKISVQYFNFFL
jgi:hypothetical protein